MGDPEGPNGLGNVLGVLLLASSGMLIAGLIFVGIRG